MKHLNIFALEGFFREQVEPRRRQEERDGKMISKSSSAIANLSEQPIYRTFRPGFQVERLKNEANEE
jgi:hypothetical protein